jgi:hypothetical protein
MLSLHAGFVAQGSKELPLNFISHSNGLSAINVSACDGIVRGIKELP